MLDTNIISYLIKSEPHPLEHTWLSKTSTADALQIRCVSHNRFIKKLGYIDDDIYEKIKSAMKIVLDL